jgi:poly(A) polymerase
MNLLLESAKEEAALDFLRQQIRGSRFSGKVYLAGGAVRDELLGLPLKDIDLVVNLKDGGIEFANWLTKKLGIWSSGNPVTFPKFGTAKFNLRGIKHRGMDLSDIDVEVVMPRTEKYTFGSRKPEVGQGSLAQDVERRDFTVNSLLKDLTTGEIKDFTGKGKADIERGIIRTPLNPDVIFRDDPLRMLRAIRFTVKYNWTLPLFMIKGIARNSHMLKHISAERIRDELDKMLVTGSPDKAVRLLQMTGLNKHIMPELDLLIGLKQNKYHIWDANKHTLEVLRSTPPNLQTRLAALFHDIGKAETREIINNEIHFYRHEEVGKDIASDIMKRLKYPNSVINAVTSMIGSHMRLKQAGKEGEVVSDKALRRLKADLGDHLEGTLDLMHADNIAHSPEHKMEKQIPGIRNRLKNLKDAPSSQRIPIPIDGNDVMRHLGIRPGPLVRTMLDVVKDKWLEDPKLSKRQALDLIEKTLKSMAR